jgi:pimeloyl-ACP methyl ester carboxylesterase
VVIINWRSRSSFPFDILNHSHSKSRSTSAVWFQYLAGSSSYSKAIFTFSSVYTFASLTNTLAAFLDALHIISFAVYIFDYGAPVFLRLALQRPDAITAII